MLMAWTPIKVDVHARGVGSLEGILLFMKQFSLYNIKWQCYPQMLDP